MIEKELSVSDRISQKLVDVAQWYLALSKTKEECERNLHIAQEGWNLACLDRGLIDDGVKKSLEKFKHLYSLNDIEIKEIEKNLRQIIKKKRNMYPRELIFINKAVLNLEDGQMKITVQAVDCNLLGAIINES
jgi:hypothetical protein